MYFVTFVKMSLWFRNLFLIKIKKAEKYLIVFIFLTVSKIHSHFCIIGYRSFLGVSTFKNKYKKKYISVDQFYNNMKYYTLIYKELNS